MFVLVDPVSTGRALGIAFREEGADTLHLYQENLRAAYDADQVPTRKLMHEDLDKTVELLEQLKPEAVIAASEFGVILADTLARRLGLAHHRPEQAAARRDKHLMVRALEEAGVPAARTVSVRSAQELEAALADWTDFPVMVKPLNSAGSDGCQVCGTAEEVRGAYRRIADDLNLMGLVNDEVLVQEFLKGTQYIVNTVSIDGRHLVCDVYAERIDLVDGAPVLRHIISRPELTEPESALVAYVLDCLDALGIREGAGHTEVMLTPRGARLVEVNSRVMGPSLAPDPYHAAYGYSHQHLVVERYLRPAEFEARFDRPYGGRQTVAKLFLRSRRQGPLRAVDGLRTLRRLPGFHSIDRLPAIGEPIGDRGLTTGEGGIAYLVHTDADVLTRSLDAVHALEDAETFFRVEEA
ncbi:ATP-grasp domain-containing protein [Kitasatospora sp. NPDC036755]|uniref:ATP-grasp domain-containing protein n=1 Tax=Kitasatospora sp. NPDC036755 TaxID=3154600 RepID=UPI0033E9C43E